MNTIIYEIDNIERYTKMYNNNIDFREKLTELFNFIIIQNTMRNNHKYIKKFDYMLKEHRIMDRIGKEPSEKRINRKNLNLIFNMMLYPLFINIHFHFNRDDIIKSTLDLIYILCYFQADHKIASIECNKIIKNIVFKLNLNVRDYISYKTYNKYFGTNWKSANYTIKLNNVTTKTIFNSINMFWEKDEILGMIMAYYLYQRHGIKHLSYEHIFIDNLNSQRQLFIKDYISYKTYNK